ncbi:MAG TPA: SLBB domain-containing protein [Thermodesulfovibrionales bacterium]|nr:SLBB domain-containing protein [Thermodesulfovibrionales bacterium]
MTKLKWFITLFLILIFSGNAFAQQIQATPITPQGQSTTSIAQPSPSIQPFQPSQPIPSQPLQSQPPAPEGVIPQATPQPAQQPPVEIEKLSEFEQFISGKAPLTVSTDIKQFGYDLFRNPPSTFAPVEKVPVGPDYVIGPGDEIRITVWGRIEGQWSAVVDRDGNINIPKVGILGVTGLSFKELKDLLYKEFSKYYTGFEMNVSMAVLRTIRVYIVGNAERPGAYTVSSLSTIVNALFEAGGPSKTGTMRDIQVKRNGKTFVHFDLYDFLLKGDKTKDLRLLPEDVIFIPPIGPIAAIAGSAKNPAIYELKGEKTILQLIEMAGGLSDIAFRGRVQIERIIDNTRQVVFESDLAQAKDTEVQAGDIVKIFQVVQDKKLVRVSGAVQRAGEYGFKTGMSVRDLISMSGGLKYYAYNKEAELTRVHITDKGPLTEKIMINLEKAIAGETESNIPLKEDDYLFVRSVPEWDLYKTVTISGEIKFPGTYTIKKGEKLSSLIERAGGYTDKAYLRGAIFTRKRVSEMQQKSLDEMINRLERELLVSGSTLSSTAMTSEEIQINKIELEQRQKFIESLRTLKPTGRMAIKLAHLRLLKNSEFDIELEEGDSLFILSENKVVNVTGAVFSPGSFVYHSEFDYRDYIDQAAGFSRYADTSNVYVLKVDGTARKLSKNFLGWNPFKSRWEVLAFEEEEKEIEPGDTIVIPEDFEKVAWLREVKDITQILFQIAVTTGVVLRLF